MCCISIWSVLNWCSAGICCWAIDWVIMVGRAVVRIRPDDVGISTGCAYWAFAGPFVTKCWVRSLGLAVSVCVSGSRFVVADNLPFGWVAKPVDFCDRASCWSVIVDVVYIYISMQQCNETECQRMKKNHYIICASLVLPPKGLIACGLCNLYILLRLQTVSIYNSCICTKHIKIDLTCCCVSICCSLIKAPFMK